MLTFLWYPKLNQSLSWGPAIAIFQPTTDCISLVHETIPLPCTRSCATLDRAQEGHCVQAPLPSDECNPNCSQNHLIPSRPTFSQTAPFQDALEAAELCSFPCVPSASKQPLCETTRAAWKSWAGKLFDAKRKLFPHEIFSTKCSISSLTIEVAGNFHLKIFPMETRFLPPAPAPSYPAPPPLSK